MDTRSALGKLIDETRAPNDWSYEDLSRKARLAGFELSKSNIARLATQQPLVSISANAIGGLAAALGISERRVAIAAVQAMGVKLDLGEPTLVEAVYDESSLTDETKRILLNIIATAIGLPRSGVALPIDAPMQRVNRARSERRGRAGVEQELPAGERAVVITEGTGSGKTATLIPPLVNEAERRHQDAEADQELPTAARQGTPASRVRAAKEAKI